jgi:hypothetical protein
METLSLFNQLKSAIAADVEVAGGAKCVASMLWPDEDIETTHKRLLNACNPKQKQELGYHDIQKLKQLARRASGASNVHAYESKQLNVKLHWVTLQEEAQQATVNLSAAFQELQAAMSQANDLMKRLSEAQK